MLATYRGGGAQGTVDVYVPSMAALTVTLGAPGSVKILAGYSSINDGGGGTFVWSNVPATHDGGVIVNPAGGTAAGWRRQSPLGNVDVKWFGAVGDSVTDDTAAINAAITSLGASGGVVWLPIGKYRLSSAILLSNSTVLRGSGFGHGSVAGTVLAQANNAYAIDAVDVRDWRVENLEVQAPASVTAIRIKASAADNVLGQLSNIKISSWLEGAGAVVLLEGSGTGKYVSFPTLRDVYIDKGGVVAPQNAGIGIYGVGAHGTQVIGARIYGGLVHACKYGLHATHSETLTCIGTAFHGMVTGGAAGVCVYLEHALFSRMFGLRFELDADTEVQFGATAADNYVDATLGSGTVINAGVRNSWRGSDGTGGAASWNTSSDRERLASIVAVDSSLCFKMSQVVCGNGFNERITVNNLATYFYITGPTAPFHVASIQMQEGFDGQIIYLHNSTSQEMTLIHEFMDYGPPPYASWRINTLAGRDITLPGPCIVKLMWDGVGQRWTYVGSDRELPTPDERAGGDTFFYNAAGQLITMTTKDALAATIRTEEYTYNAGGRLATRTRKYYIRGLLNRTITETLTYNGVGDLSSIARAVS